MEDSQIVELYWARSEQAIMETSDKYLSLIHIYRRKAAPETHS